MRWLNEWKVKLFNDRVHYYCYRDKISELAYAIVENVSLNVIKNFRLWKIMIVIVFESGWFAKITRNLFYILKHLSWSIFLFRITQLDAGSGYNFWYTIMQSEVCTYLFIMLLHMPRTYDLPITMYIQHFVSRVCIPNCRSYIISTLLYV